MGRERQRQAREKHKRQWDRQGTVGHRDGGDREIETSQRESVKWDMGKINRAQGERLQIGRNA